MKKIIPVLFVIICFSAAIFARIPVKTLVNISKAEDELRFDAVLENLLKDKDARIRTRAALAVGRIGDEAALAALVILLEKDSSTETRAMAAFAIGEIESIAGADAILKILNDLKNPSLIRARAIEAAGKIAAANAKDGKSKTLGEAILSNLEFENRKRSGPYENVIEFGLTAVLRARPAEAEKTVVVYTNAYTPQIRANALNTLARLRAKNANENARTLLQKDADAVVRANAARVLGAAEDKDALELLLNAAVSDEDSRVRVSAIRSLGSLKDAKSAEKLLERGEKLLADYKKSKFANPSEKSELLEIATVLGRVLEKTDNEKALKFLKEIRELEKYRSPELEIAYAQISPKTYLSSKKDFPSRFNSGLIVYDWQAVNSWTQGVSELAKLPVDNNDFKETREKAKTELLTLLNRKTLIQSSVDTQKLINAIPGILTAFAGYKSDELDKILQEYLLHYDLFVRATAAELLGEQTATKENIEALKNAFANSLKTDKDYDDAQLAILSALVKLDKQQSTESLKLALNAPNYLVRRRAANLIKQNDLTKAFPNAEKQVGTVKPYDAKTGTKLGQVLNTEADYFRAVSRKNGSVKAVFTTEKGRFTIDLLPEDASLTVDNFIKLARKNYFNGLQVHRVVPNFVMQDGDPLGNGSGGPGWSIRCEMNTVAYERGAVGMALSGKDTGGSQWFVTHSPQPHLDGGYTVFGKVNEADMKIVDSIVRGDKILKVEIIEKK